jgi:hypothetical protein
LENMSNQELRELYITPALVAYIERRNLEFFRNMISLDKTKYVENIFLSKPDVRTVRWPRLRWEEKVRK